jgi:type II secretory pathway predicted ATPase ExeA
VPAIADILKDTQLIAISNGPLGRSILISFRTARCMFRKYWGLRESPFRPALDWRRFFPSPTHEEALARLDFLLDQGRRLGWLFGPTGCGKSLVLEVFARKIRRTGAQVANLSLCGADLHEFLWLIAAELGTNPDRSEGAFRLWRGVLDRLTENRYQQLDTVLLLDDAQQAHLSVLEHVVRLAQLEGKGGGGLTIVLAADRAHCLPGRLMELAELRIDLEPWEPADTTQYVTKALERAGATFEIFTDDALRHLHDRCQGVPRRVIKLANLALLAGAGRHANHIDADIVDSADHELGAVEAVA